MNTNITQLLDLIAQIAPNKYLQAFLITVVFAVIAKIADIIMTPYLKTFAKKDQNHAGR